MKDIISIDESAFNCNRITTKGWVKKQKMAMRPTLRRFKCITLISAISFTGENDYAFVIGNNNSRSFINFLEKLVNKYD
jgi:hypothetical protein